MSSGPRCNPNLSFAEADSKTTTPSLVYSPNSTLHRNNLPWMFQATASPPRTADWFANVLSRDDSAFLVAETDRIVGVAHGLLRSAPELPVFIPQRWGLLDSLVVDSAWRRRGIGGLLAKAIEAWALNEGASWVELSVYRFNAEALQFYEALGYLPLRTIVRKPLPRAT